MITVERFQKLKRQEEESRREADRAQGALENLLKRLKEEFGCASEEEAQKLLKRLSKESEKLEASLEEKVRRLEEEYKEKV
jgi:predicted transcriptional regulator